MTDTPLPNLTRRQRRGLALELRRLERTPTPTAATQNHRRAERLAELAAAAIITGLLLGLCLAVAIVTADLGADLLERIVR